MYRIVFGGALLDGFSLPEVRQQVASRLHLGEAQLASLFSGKTVVMKKAVSEPASLPYLAELARLGLRVWMEPLPAQTADDQPPLSFKVVFWGKVLTGYTREQVMRRVPRRLRVSETQLESLFSGAKAVLKRGVTAEVGARYVTELARIGMQVELEVEASSMPAAAQPALAQPSLADYGQDSFLRTQLEFQRASQIFDSMSSTLEHEPSPPPVEQPAPPQAEKLSDAQRRERLMTAIEAARIEVLGLTQAPALEASAELPALRCSQCGHRQSSGAHCSACGCAFAGTAGNAAGKAASLAYGLKPKAVRRSVIGADVDVDPGTLMLELRQQRRRERRSGSTGTPRQGYRAPLALAGGVCVLMLGGWLLLAR
ncbi:hypothetical protein [Uliginosibacterium sediminicola]|uniref:Uncharacterized protein n=1 Tax=Uliginosibacterium sediminicola TaxID=2024550 RepID=A0ABU9YTL1_9RHOO